MKKHPIIILIVVLVVIGIIIFIIANGNKATTATTVNSSGITPATVFPVLRAANDPSTLPVATRTVNGRPIML